ncbi:hypothetical protein EJ05DRAFT_13247 [Pseudovirgaria hyperparasitica]|uniref:Uncharacterized protein n=1 Tax=Pseudovirgaria hyperparasitica TaxID=470096 RepID=A0A6A6WKN5_9PEZI|nr:uncharacterized protein EJ05DRAFT_13247 [Pseudovirgaria hyperparasitica]KAF2762755.1 hypothetical protein EJ05DRAFT_13247 [Pseudovirgaria hyperparasitica]
MAAQGFDKLLEYLLDQVTYCGTDGANTTDVKRFIDDFYRSKENPVSDELDIVSTTHPKTQVDRHLQEHVWNWLIAQPGVFIGEGDIPTSLSLRAVEELEARESMAKTTAQPSDTGRKTKKTSKAKSVTFESPNKTSSPGAPRIHVSEERIWKALTGHEKDLRRVPLYEFQLLSRIGFAGSDGILQPVLVIESGQDKRSVPKRTDQLHAKGYIEKRGVLSSDRKARTSLLTLKCLVKTKSDDDTPHDDPKRPFMENGSLDYLKFLDFIMHEVRQHGKVIALSDLYRDLDAYGNVQRWKRKVVSRALKRLCAIGLADRLRAKDTRFPKRYHRSLRMLRDPTQADREAFSTFVSKPTRTTRFQDEGDGADEEDNEDENDEDVDTQLEKEFYAGDEEGDELIEEDVFEVERVATWSPNFSIANQLFRGIESGGSLGLTAIMTRALIFGQFWKRPMESVLSNLTNDWQINQPPHLQHLAIIRDTEQSIDQRGAHFLYRSYGHYASLVDEGLVNWDAVTRASDIKAKKVKKPKRNTTLDAWGFPQQFEEGFISKTGVASLAEGTSIINLKAKFRFDGSKIGQRMQCGGPRIGRPPKAEKSRRELKEEKQLRDYLEVVREQARNLVRHRTLQRYRAHPDIIPELPQLPNERSKPASHQPSENKKAPKINGKSRGGRKRKLDNEVVAEVAAEDSAPGAANPVINPVTKRRKIGENEKPQAVYDVDADLPTQAQGCPAQIVGLDQHVTANAADVSHEIQSNDVISRSQMTFEEIEAEIYKKLVTEGQVESMFRKLLRKEGPGLYINPPGSERTYSKQGRPSKGLILVFKFSKLADFEWFTSTGDASSKAKHQHTQHDLPADILRLIGVDCTESCESTGNSTAAAKTKQQQIVANVGSASNFTSLALQTSSQTLVEETANPISTIEQIHERPKTYVSPYSMAATQGEATQLLQASATHPPSTDRQTTHDESSKPNRNRKKYASQTTDRRDRKRGVRLGEGNILVSRAQLVMEIIKLAGGLFPGHGALNTAYKTLWRQRLAKKASEISKVPDHKTIGRAVKDLVHNSQLVKMVFSFTKNGITAQRGIVALPHFRPNSPEIRQLQMRIIERYPETYFPPAIHHLIPPSKIVGGSRGHYREVLPINQDVAVEIKHPFKKDLLREEKLFEKTQKRKEETAQRKARKKEEKQQAKEARKRHRNSKSTSKVKAIDGRHRSDVDGVDTRMRPTHNVVMPQMLTYQGITLQTEDVDHIWMPDSRAEFERLRRDVDEVSDDDSSLDGDPSRQALVQDAGLEYIQTRVGDLPVERTVLPLVYRSRGFDFASYVPQADLSKSLLLPKISRHESTGTYGTSYEPWRYAYDMRFLKDETEHAFWEAGMPQELSDIQLSKTYQQKNHGQEQETSRARFNRIIDGVCNRECRDVRTSKYVFYTDEDDLLHNPLTPRLRTPRFINHTIPTGTQVLAPYTEPKWGGPSNDGSPPQLNTDGNVHWNHNDSFTCVFPDKPPDEYLSPEWKAFSNEMKALSAAMYPPKPPPRKRERSRYKRRKRHITNLVEALTKEKAPPAAKARKKRAPELKKRKKFGPRNSQFVVNARDMKKLLYAAVVVKVIAGGTRAAVPWHLIYYMFRFHENLDLMVLKNRLLWMDHHYSDLFQKLQDNFREAFIPAYERGEVPELDFQDLEHYDWDFILDWAMNNLHVQENAPDLPQSRDAFIEMYQVEELPAEYLSRQKARFFKADEMMGNRRAAVHSLPFSALLETTQLKINEKHVRHEADVALGKSWLRANTTTPMAMYDKYGAMTKLSELGDALAQMSVNALIREKVFAHRTKGRTMVPGRNYHFTNQFEKALRADVAPGALTAAVRYKLELDEAFTGLGDTTVEEAAEDQDGDIVMISERSVAPRAFPISQMMKTHVAIVNLNLLASHRIRISPELPRFSNEMPFDRGPGIFISRWGFAQGHYSTRKLPREAFHWPLSVTPTDQYKTGIKQVPVPPSTKDCMSVARADYLQKRSPRLQQKEHIPLWRTLNDQMIPHWWARFTACVLNILATRASIRSSHIVSILNGYLDVTEVEVALAWLETNGVIKKMPESSCWVLQEEWWSILGGDVQDYGPKDDRWVRDVELKIVEDGVERTADDLSKASVGKKGLLRGRGDVRYGHADNNAKT